MQRGTKWRKGLKTTFNDLPTDYAQRAQLAGFMAVRMNHDGCAYSCVSPTFPEAEWSKVKTAGIGEVRFRP
jgi:hypothetical protein